MGLALTAFLIALGAICMCIVTWIAFACIWLVKQARWLRAVLVPWMDSIFNEIKAKQ